ncbi:MAG: major capsid protein P2 [Pseudomonadota bacterium]
MSETVAAVTPLTQASYRDHIFPDFENVAPGDTATMREQRGYMYHYVDLKLSGGLLPSHLSNIRVKVSDTEIYTSLRGADLDVVNFFHGFDDAETVATVRIPFAAPGLKNPLDEIETSLNIQVPDPVTGVVFTHFDVEVDIADNAPATARLKAVGARQAAALNIGPGIVRQMRAYRQLIPAEGEFTMRDIVTPGLPIASRQFLNGLYMNIDPRNVREIILTRSGRQEFRLDPIQNEINQRALGKKPVANWTIIDFRKEGLGYSGVDLRQQTNDFDLRVQVQNRPDGTVPPNSFRYLTDMTGVPVIN